ncbi:MAG: hypothetical protein Q9208_000882 [Pyrenodesmia sp. 3 TL-2023]
MAYNQSSEYHADEQATDEQRAIRLQQIQLEALGTQRRDQISTDDFKDRNRDQLSLRDMERRRRVNQYGTTESAVATGEKDRLKGWNTAWNTLKDDGILEKGLEDINAGQSHRARLLAQAFPVHTPTPPSLPPPSSALEEAQRFHLGATVRVPITVERASLPQYMTPKPRVLLPSVTGRPAAPVSLKENARPVRARAGFSSSAADASRTLRRKGESFKLVEPNQFMAYVNAGQKAVTATSGGMATSATSGKKAISASIASPAMQPSSTTGVPRAPDGESGIQPRPHPITELPPTLLLDTSERIVTEGTTPGRPTTYADDLLGMEIDVPQELPQPMELTKKTGNADSLLEEHCQLRAMEEQLASFLPYLTAMLPSEAVEKLISVRSLLQQKLGNPGQAGSVMQQLPASNEPRSVLPEEKELKTAPRGLASTVEQRTSVWKKQVIASTVNTKGSIFGEHVVRSRWTERHQRHDSTASAASSTGLVEGLKKLRLDEAQPATEFKLAKATEYLTSQYATANPFGAKPANGGPALPGLNRARQGESLELAAPTARPQVPDYVRSGYTIGDHGAAVRAQYLGSASLSMNEFDQGALSNAASTKIATSSAHESVVNTSQGPIVWRNHATTSTKPAAFLHTLQPAKDPGAAARAQYSQGADSLPQQIEQSSVQPSPRQSRASRSTDMSGPSGEFTRQQYSQTELTGLREQAAPAGAQFESLPKAPKRAEAPQGPKGKKITDYFGLSSAGSSPIPLNEQNSQQPRYESGSNKPEFQQSKGPAPRPRPWLAESITVSDPGAAVRKQYGMK